VLNTNGEKKLRKRTILIYFGYFGLNFSNLLNPNKKIVNPNIRVANLNKNKNNLENTKSLEAFQENQYHFEIVHFELVINVFCPPN
jgi:hypothetical protein